MLRFLRRRAIVTESLGKTWTSVQESDRLETEEPPEYRARLAEWQPIGPLQLKGR